MHIVMQSGPCCDIHEKAHGKVLDGERAIEIQSPLVEGMQDVMTSVSRCCCAVVSLATRAKFQELTAKSMLMDFLWLW